MLQAATIGTDAVQIRRFLLTQADEYDRLVECAKDDREREKHRARARFCRKVRQGLKDQPGLYHQLRHQQQVADCIEELFQRDNWEADLDLHALTVMIYLNTSV